MAKQKLPRKKDAEQDDLIATISVSPVTMNSPISVAEAGGNMENLGLVQPAIYIPFSGGIDITRDRYQLPLGSFSAIQNMRPLRPGFETRKGCRLLHTTTDKSAGTPMTLYMMSKGKEVQRKFLAQWGDGDIQIATTAPPAVTTGNFSGADLFASGTSGLVPASWSMFNDILIACDGTGVPLSYPGTASPVSRLVVVKAGAAHPMMIEIGEDYSIEVIDGDATTAAILDSLGDLATDYDAYYVMTDTPADAFTLAFISGKENTTASALQIHYCKGDAAWSAVGSLVDGTIVASGGSGTPIFSEDFEDAPSGWTQVASGDGAVSYTAAPISGGGTQSGSFSDTVGSGSGLAYIKRNITECLNFSLEFDLVVDRMDNVIEGGSVKIFSANLAGAAYILTMYIYNPGSQVFRLYCEALWNTGQANFSDYVDINLDTKYNVRLSWVNPGTFEWWVDDVSQGTQSVNAQIDATPIGIDQAIFGLGTDEVSGPFSPTIVLMDNIVVNEGGSPVSATHGKDGTASFAMPTDIVPTYMFAKTGYWYRFSLASGDLDSEVEMKSMTYEGDMLRIHNVFDDVPSPAIEAYFDDASVGTTLFYAASAITLDAMTSSDKLTFNFLFPVEAIYIDVGATPNATASTSLTLKYWDGDGMTSVTTLTDGTNGLKKSGWLTFARPVMQKSIFRSGSYYSYWFELTTNNTMSADMVIYVEGIPFFDFKDFGKAISCCAWKNRMVYSFDRVPGYVLITADGTPFSLNGSDLAIRDIGDGRANKAVCIKRFYNDIMVWQEEKGKEGGCLTMLQGYTPQNFGKLLLSSRYGTFSSKSAIVVDDCSYYEKDREGDARFMGSRTLAFWISREGIFMCNGKTVTGISQSNIRPYFDPASSSCLRRGYENAHWIEYDSRHQGLRVGLVTGTTATKPNTFLFYDIISAAWSIDVLTQPFSCVVEVEADSGDAPVVQVAGGAGDGFIYQTNYGTADVATLIDDFATMEVSAQNTIVELLEIILRCRVQSAGSIEITPYINGYAQSARSVVMQALVANDGMRRNRIGMDLKGEHLSFRFRNATINESMVLYDVGFILLSDGRK
jgi:hypothetical protein